ncbi:hypothetical protein CWC48_28175 [Pseudomonas sp. S10E 269]|nr:hypothetical protein CWC49_08615 [Pseudomonas sp. S09F 262]PJK42844.1 hypothetical protein CWC48_28175 [Pseudomonas sp. S10E 269]
MDPTDPAITHPPCRSRLAGDEALEPCDRFGAAIAGKPAPTEGVLPVRNLHSPHPLPASTLECIALRTTSADV